jgi:transposase-like protein
MSGRMTPFFCPYCGEEDLRPNESSHGAWECRACVRVFSVRFVGMLAASAHHDDHRSGPLPDRQRAGAGRGGERQEETR